VGELLLTLGRHNLRPSHLHMMIDAPGFHKLTTALYPEGDAILASDAVFGVKKSLVVVSKVVASSSRWASAEPRLSNLYFCLRADTGFLCRNSPK